MYLLHAINSDRQTRLLIVLGQIAMYWEGKKGSVTVDCLSFGKEEGWQFRFSVHKPVVTFINFFLVSYRESNVIEYKKYLMLHKNYVYTARHINLKESLSALLWHTGRRCIAPLVLNLGARGKLLNYA